MLYFKILSADTNLFSFLRGIPSFLESNSYRKDNPVSQMQPAYFKYGSLNDN